MSWSRASLRSKIFLAFSTLILGVLVAMFGLTQLVIGRDAAGTLNRELRTTGQVFESLLQQRAARLQSNSVLLANDFALKRVFATHFDPASYDAETLASAGLSYRQRLGVELVWMADESGTLLAASPSRAPAGESLARSSPLKEALESQSAASAVVQIDGQLFQVVAVPVFAPDVIGFLMLGQVIDDSVAARLKRDTHSDVSFLTAAHVFASSWPADSRSRLLKLVSHLPGAGAATLARPVTMGDERFVSLVLPVAAHLPQPLYALIQGSYDKALAPLHALQWRIAAIGIAALVTALLTGLLLSGNITDPVRTLVDSMDEVARGNLRQRAPIERPDEIGFLARSFNVMVAGLQEKEHIKDTFGRFVSHDVAEAVLNNRVPLTGERLEVSILFQDIRGFSVLSESLDPARLLRVLNQFFTEVVAAVEAEGGMVKQFTGDGVMALFGAPRPCPDHAQRAVRAALGLVARLALLNTQLRAQGLPPLRIGVGIHAGEVVAGLIGPDQRVEYGVVGDAVNLASRVEELTKDFGATILISKEIAARLGSEFVLGRSAMLPVKGKAQPVEVIEVVPGPNACADSAA
jgi:adenylate cyclase